MPNAKKNRKRGVSYDYRTQCAEFQSWENTGKLQIAPLTGFFGANSSGKTSLFQTLLMLKQTAERRRLGMG